jgi:hypothetical protein
MGHDNYVEKLSMPSADSHPRSKADKTKLTCKPATLHGDTYRDIVKKFLQEQGTQQGEPMQTRSMSHIGLLHDRHPAHTSRVFSTYTRKIQLKTQLLPPCSPDLTPMDSGFFGTVKGRVQAEVRQQRLTWENACQRMEEVLNSEPSLKYIEDLPLRWQACINVKGWHIEHELHRLKQKAARHARHGRRGNDV